jgi:hypothetical protein
MAAFERRLAAIHYDAAVRPGQTASPPPIDRTFAIQSPIEISLNS